MLEPIDKLRGMCQKKDYKKTGNMMARLITRDMALYITRLLIPTGITANQVVFLTIMMGIISAACFAFGGGFMMLAGALFFQLWYLSDHVDGQIARYRNASSLTGAFYDFYAHYIVHSLVLGGLALGLYMRYENLGILILGLAACFSVNMVSLINDCVYKAFYNGLSREEKDLTFRAGSQTAEKNKIREGLPKKIFMFMHKLTEIHVIMNVVTIAVIVDFFFGTDLILFETAVLALVATAVWVFKLARIVTAKEVDRKYSEFFRGR
ncbi:MAG: CDP-alcohol phosphatidyltransferase family protein [bacterium]|nr:CDP-alcohol phosphatidyltransferase family protein [bacterium]